MPRLDRNALSARIHALRSDRPVLLRRLPGLSDYAATLAAMRERAAALARGEGPEEVWFLEHPPLYTAGTSARAEELLDPHRLPVFRTGRGGRYTYHGPGQRIVYLMLDLRRRGRDVRAFVTALEQWIIDTLADFGIAADRREDRVGVWVRRPEKGPDREEKIAAIGVRVSRWITHHGIALNVAPDLAHYDGIVPCGIAEHGVTSLADLGVKTDMAAVDAALAHHFVRLFGPIEERAAPNG